MVSRYVTTAALAVVLTASAPSWGAPQVIVRSAADYDPNGCGFRGDGEVLTITDGNRVLLTKNYCSAYGKSEAQIISDALARNDVLVTHSEGHGTNASTDYLTVYRLTDRLIKRTRITISEGVGISARWFYDYKVETPEHGGLKLVLTLRVDGKPDFGMVPPDHINDLHERRVTLALAVVCLMGD